MRSLRSVSYGCIKNPDVYIRSADEWALWRTMILDMEYNAPFCQDLLESKVDIGTVLERLERLYGNLKGKKLFAAQCLWVRKDMER